MRRLVALAALVAAAATASSVRATTQPGLLMHVKVGLLPAKITLSSNYAARGLEVEFRVTNKTTAKRYFSVAGKTIVVPAKKLRITAISFQARGRYKVVSRVGARRVTTIFRVT